MSCPYVIKVTKEGSIATAGGEYKAQLKDFLKAAGITPRGSSMASMIKQIGTHLTGQMDFMDGHEDSEHEFELV